MDRDTLSSYPGFNKGFKICANASNFQLVAVISQKGKLIAFYGRKLYGPQRSYKVIEMEILSIVETLKEFRTILLGKILIVYTDHKNLICATFNTDRVLRWRLIIEEYVSDI